MVTILLAKALICFAGNCYPVLIGEDTRPGVYQIHRRHVLTPGYGGDVLQYDEDDKAWYGIHRVWTGKPSERRRERLESGVVADRIGVTNGCPNVSEEVYEKLLDCCTDSQLIIK